GTFGNTVLSVLISLACFTTAVGIVTGTADYFKGLIKNSQTVYMVTAVVACVFGVIVGQLDFNSIIVIALPVLLFIYPITIVLILLNAIPNKYASSLVFKVVVLLTFVFSIPDVVGFLSPSESLAKLIDYIPFAKHSLGWVLPAFIGFVLVNVLQKTKLNSSNS
ncbi:MAG: branched-chain amino acid transport system II carrier protein, partial [Olleya sp.]